MPENSPILNDNQVNSAQSDLYFNDHQTHQNSWSMTINEPCQIKTKKSPIQNGPKMSQV